MHRVELKGEKELERKSCAIVPNAPCGVERFLLRVILADKVHVPNAPCGVERKKKRQKNLKP